MTNGIVAGDVQDAVGIRHAIVCALRCLPLSEMRQSTTCRNFHFHVPECKKSKRLHHSFVVFLTIHVPPLKALTLVI